MIRIWMGLLATVVILVGHGEAWSCKPELQGHFRNLARGRPAFQSSLYPLHNIGLASKAVDGNCNGDWYNIKSCTHTNRDYEPWWYVDLGEEYAIATVVVKNRGDCCGERLQGAQIRVGNYGGNNCKSNFHCGTITDTRAGSISTISCYGFKGRYVSIIIPNRREWLHVCEVEVYGTKEYSQLYHGKSCSHTHDDYEPWWYVDLGEEYAIAAVVVKNRGDCCGERLRGAQSRVGNYGGNNCKSNFHCGTITDTRAGSISTISCYGFKGRYVSIIIPNRREWLHVCEVEVYGTKEYIHSLGKQKTFVYTQGPCPESTDFVKAVDSEIQATLGLACFAVIGSDISEPGGATGGWCSSSNESVSPVSAAQPMLKDKKSCLPVHQEGPPTSLVSRMIRIWMGLLATVVILVGHGEAWSCKPELQGHFRNLARGRPAFQSSLYPLHNIGLASKAVDGNCNGDWYNIKSCTHTNRDYEPWWYVDLGEEYAIATVVVKNRGDCCGERLQGAQIRVGNYGGNNCKSNFQMFAVWIRLLGLALLAGHGEGQSCGVNGYGPNLARGRPTYQSSIYLEHGPDLLSGKAVDGICQGDVNAHRSCTHTNEDLEPWWYVDLGRQFPIDVVIVKNRGDCCDARLRGAEIHVGDSLVGHGKFNPLCETIQETSLGAISTIRCQGLPGRYVSIHIPVRREYLTLCEVEVYAMKPEMFAIWTGLLGLALLAGCGEGQSCGVNGYGPNLARGRPTYQSSIYLVHGPDLLSGKAVDGICQGDLNAHRSCTHTNEDLEPWWYVDLGRQFPIDVVIVKNRGDCCDARLRGAEIHVGDSLVGHGKFNPLCETIQETSLGAISTIRCQGLPGRYVSIHIPVRREYLTLCEVEVYAMKPEMLPIWTGLLALALLFGLGEGESCRPGAQDVVRNVAKGCSAYQSSTYQHPKNLIAEKAVDGDCSGNLPRDGSCSHTNADLDPWWYVDLGENYTVFAVLVKNRQDCCAERLDKAQVRVGYSVAANSKFNPLCGTIQDSSAGSISTIQCNQLVGRIVSINIPNEKEYLTLCEVEVYAMKVAEVCP
nr:uncharacterized protein LOC132773555 [Anolis sagrei ordinatus]